MKLSELSGANPELKVLIYGPSGSGKTCFIATCPGPILLLDFDGKANSIINYLGPKHPKLNEIEVEDLRSSLVADPIKKFLEITRSIEADIKKGTFKYKTIVLDSLTVFSYAALTNIVATNPGVKRPAYAQGIQPTMTDYGILRREFARIIPGFIGLPCNIVMLGHIKTEKDELTGEIVRQVQLDGSFGAELPIYFEEVYLMQVGSKGERTLLTDGRGRYPCRTQRGLPAEVKPDYEEVIRLTKSKN